MFFLTNNFNFTGQSNTMNTFEKTVEIRWSDVDQNRHVRHSAYYDYGAATRIAFLNEAGFGSNMLESLHIGPILFKEECSFIREIQPNDQIRMNMLKGEVAEDGSRWKMHHELFNQRDEKVAHITILGAWMDLEKRRLTIPPVELAIAFQSLPEGSDFVYGKKS